MVGRGRSGARGKGRGGPSLSKAGARGGFPTTSVASTNDTCLDARQSNGQWSIFTIREPCGLHVNPGFAQSHFSLSEEARNTERHHSWNSDLRLRYSRVAFISAGTSTAQDLNPVIPKSKISSEAIKSSFQIRSGSLGKADENLPTAYIGTPDAQLSNMTLNDLQSASNVQVTSEAGLDSAPKRSNVDSGVRSTERSNEAPLIDKECADELLHTGLETPIMRRSQSPTGSNSSGDIIIFAGRRRNGDQKHTLGARLSKSNALHVLKPSGRLSSMSTVIDDPIDATAQRIQISPKCRPSSFLATDSDRAPGYVSCDSKVTATEPRRRRRRRPSRKGKEDEGILEDYVENLRDGDALETFVETCMLNKRDLGGADTAEWQGEVESFTSGRVEKDSVTSSEGWDSADLENFYQLSTSDEVLESIEQVLAKRERPSGVQYLVVGAGYTVDEARWCPVSSLKAQGAKTLIQEFESNAELDYLRNGSDVSVANLTIDQQVAQDLQEGLDDKEDEKDLEERRKASMTDEQIARLLSKQEELGLGSDDLMLYDGGDVGTDSQEELQLDGLWERAVTHRGASRSKKTKRSRSHLPSATAFADVLDLDPYNGFDVLDQQRPSLRKRPKGRRGKLSLELSDSELEHSIHTAWEKDRIKKKMRKQAREEFRAQGLSGKINKTDLKAKYPAGISIIEVKNEIREFLLSSMDRYVSLAVRLIINIDGNLVCRFPPWLRESAKWCMKLPASSN